VNGCNSDDGSGAVAEELNLLLLQVVDLQERVLLAMETLKRKGLGQPQMEEHVQQVLSEVSVWVDECTKPAEDQAILLRRMQVHKERLQRLEELIRAANL
jgi:hypothetical protein